MIKEPTIIDIMLGASIVLSALGLLIMIFWQLADHGLQLNPGYEVRDQ